jgi:hypothetical protein
MFITYEIYTELIRIRKGSRVTGWAFHSFNVVLSAPRMVGNKFMYYDSPK